MFKKNTKFIIRYNRYLKSEKSKILIFGSTFERGKYEKKKKS